MRRTSLLLATLVVAALLISACGAEETRTDVPATELATDTVEPTFTAEALGTETVSPDETTTPGIPVTGEEDPARLSNQLGYDVWNQNGEQIGEVNDMILDLDNTRISYVIVGTGGFLEIGEKDVLVPWNSLKLERETGDATGGERAFVYLGDQERFNNAPDWDVNIVLPGIGEPAGDWDNEIRAFWESGTLPPTASPDLTATPSPEATAVPEDAEPGALQGVVLASDALGAPMRVHAQEDFEGEVDDMIVDIESGAIQYVVVHAGFDDGEHWIPIPPRVLLWDAANDRFVLSVDLTTLQGAPFFVDGAFPDTSADGWNSEFDAYWSSY